MPVNHHSMGYSHSWAYFGSSFFKYSELMLFIYTDRRAETRTTVTSAAAFKHGCTPLCRAASYHFSAKGYYYPHNLPHSCSQDPFQPPKATAGNSLNNQFANQTYLQCSRYRAHPQCSSFSRRGRVRRLWRSWQCGEGGNFTSQHSCSYEDVAIVPV